MLFNQLTIVFRSRPTAFIPRHVPRVLRRVLFKSMVRSLQSIPSLHLSHTFVDAPVMLGEWVLHHGGDSAVSIEESRAEQGYAFESLQRKDAQDTVETWQIYKYILSIRKRKHVNIPIVFWVRWATSSTVLGVPEKHFLLMSSYSVQHSIRV